MTRIEFGMTAKETMKDHPEYQYLNLLKEALEEGVEKVDRGTNIKLYSLFGRQCRYDLSKGFPMLTTKRVYWKGVLHELYWFMSGQSNIKYLVDNDVHIWDDYPYKIYLRKSKIRNSKFEIRNLMTKEEFIEKIRTDERFAKVHGELPRIYGEMWRRWPTHSSLHSSGQAHSASFDSAQDKGSGRAKTRRTIDQLKWVLSELKEDPDAKNLIVTSWNPEYLYTMARRLETSYFPICHNMYQISQRDGKLSLQLYQRSADLFLGVPFNIASYSLLTMILAKVAGYKPGEFVHTFGDVHIYENHIEQVKEQLKREPRPFPNVSFSKTFKDIDDFLPDYVLLEGYNPYPTIKGDLTVAGGFYDPQEGYFSSA